MSRQESDAFDQAMLAWRDIIARRYPGANMGMVRWRHICAKTGPEA